MKIERKLLLSDVTLGLAFILLLALACEER